MRQLSDKEKDKLNLSNEKTLLVDGSWLLKRSMDSPSKEMQYGTSDIRGLYFFYLTLRNVVKELEITKVVIMWDGENSGKMRHLIYVPYKANRTNKVWSRQRHLTQEQIDRENIMKQSMAWNKSRIKCYAEELFLRQLEVDEIEGDDLIAYYCKQFHDKEKIIIYTNDSDLCQLIIYDNVSVYFAREKKLITKENYFLFHKIHYTNIALAKSIIGDDSDNIKGIKGIKETTLLKLFPEIMTETIDIEYIKNKLLLKESTKKQTAAEKNILRGIFNELGEKGFEHLFLNYKLVNLQEPFVNRIAIGRVHDVAMLKIDPEGRGSANLIPMMKEDGIFNYYKGDFHSFVKPFFTVIVQEKNK